MGAFMPTWTEAASGGIKGCCFVPRFSLGEKFRRSDFGTAKTLLANESSFPSFPLGRRLGHDALQLGAGWRTAAATSVDKHEAIITLGAGESSEASFQGHGRSHQAREEITGLHCGVELYHCLF
jgi:hypothetical protein